MFGIDPMYTSDDVRRTADNGGSFYFSPKTMKAWNSRLLEGFWPTNWGRTSGFVVVSNQDRYAGTPREYCVVEVSPITKDSGHAGLNFNKVRTFDSARKAKAWAKSEADALLNLLWREEISF